MNANALKILVVDDHADVRLGTARVLERAGFVTILARNGEEALAITHADPPHLVLLDWDMPGLDGLEVCRRIKANPACRDVLVIVTNAELEQHRHHQEKRVAQLNAILGLSQILSRTPLTAEQQDCVDKILISGRSLLDLLNDILDYSE